jgi:hypothetical protein
VAQGLRIHEAEQFFRELFHVVVEPLLMHDQTEFLAEYMQQNVRSPT